MQHRACFGPTPEGKQAPCRTDQCQSPAEHEPVLTPTFPGLLEQEERAALGSPSASASTARAPTSEWPTRPAVIRMLSTSLRIKSRSPASTQTIASSCRKRPRWKSDIPRVVCSISSTNPSAAERSPRACSTNAATASAGILRSSAPDRGVSAIVAPQDQQNRARSGFSSPHLGQAGIHRV